MSNEEKCFQLILHSGNARSLSQEALTIAKEEKIEAAKKRLEESKIELLEAQKLHAQMLRDMANAEEVKVDLLLIHAEDHVASSQCHLSLATEIIELYERLGEMNG